VVEDFIQNVVRKGPWSQPVMLCRFDHILVMVHNGLKFLFAGILDLGGEPDIGF
jgi:hypothetical protein